VLEDDKKLLDWSQNVKGSNKEEGQNEAKILNSR
jgi:hypothetical protein